MQLLRTAVSVLIFLSFSFICAAQEVSPPINECGHKCSGEFSVKNNGLTPFLVTVEAHSFSISKTRTPILRALDTGVSVRFSETSARLGPKAIHAFDYKVKCSQYPCLIQILSSMVVGHTPNGTAVRLQIPHVVYVCDKEKNCRNNAILSAVK